MQLPGHLANVIQPLFDALPLDRAMPDLCPRHPADQLALKTVHDIVDNEAVANRPELIAGLWLYVDEIDAAHKVAQGLANQTGSYWHAIVHRREGDFSNSLYWYSATGAHPVMTRIEGYDPRDLVELAKTGNDRALPLQRSEWAALFEWCAVQWA